VDEVARVGEDDLVQKRLQREECYRWDEAFSLIWMPREGEKTKDGLKVRHTGLVGEGKRSKKRGRERKKKEALQERALTGK